MTKRNRWGLSRELKRLICPMNYEKEIKITEEGIGALDLEYVEICEKDYVLERIILARGLSSTTALWDGSRMLSVFERSKWNICQQYRTMVVES